jgi:DNA modification methylase
MEQNLRIELITLSSLRLDPNNARRHDKKNLQAIKGSLSLFGQRKPIVISGDNTIVAGNGTVEAARELGWTEIYVARIPHDWTPEQIKAYALADNRTAELAEWDSKILADQLLELDAEGWDVAEFGFEPLEPPINPDDEGPLNFDDAPARVQLGEIWKLGNHILACGDSTDSGIYNKLLGEEKVDVIFTDPPWNVNYGGAVEPGNAQGYKVRTIMNDHMEAGQWNDFVKGFCVNLKSYSKPGAPIYLVMSAQEWPVIDLNLREAGFHWSSTIIWAKDRLVLSRKDYHTQYEPIWYGWNDSAARLVEVADRKQTDLWQIDRPSKSELHPTTKPIELITKALQNSSKVGDIVLDAFGGSGSTLIGAEKTKRRCRMIELDPKYCDVIIERWEKLTGQEAERVEL